MMTSLKLLLKQTLPPISYSKTKAWKNKLIYIPLLPLLAGVISPCYRFTYRISPEIVLIHAKRPAAGPGGCHGRRWQ